MDPVKKIKDHIIALNHVSYDDDAQLEFYFSQLKETLRQIFGAHSQYVTYLSSIRFHPISPLVSVEESIRCWARGKKKLRDLLFVVLDEPALKEYESWDERELDREAVVEVAAAEQIVANVERQVDASARGGISSSLIDLIQAFKNKVRVDMSLADDFHQRTFGERSLGEETEAVNFDGPRVRIDLRDLCLLDDGVETYLVHPSSFLPKNSEKKVLFIPCSDLRQNQKVRRFFNATEATLVEATEFPAAGSYLFDRETNGPLIQMAIVALSGDCQGSSAGEDAHLSHGPSPAVCFQLGCLVGKLGAGRVIALYEESSEFRRPTGYFDLIYIAMTPSGIWRSELAQCLKENKIAVKDAAQPLFYRG